MVLLVEDGGEVGTFGDRHGLDPGHELQATALGESGAHAAVHGALHFLQLLECLVVVAERPRLGGVALGVVGDLEGGDLGQHHDGRPADLDTGLAVGRVHAPVLRLVPETVGGIPRPRDAVHDLSVGRLRRPRGMAVLVD